jgi:hypothetical protein
MLWQRAPAGFPDGEDFIDFCDFAYECADSDFGSTLPVPTGYSQFSYKNVLGTYIGLSYIAYRQLYLNVTNNTLHFKT